MMVRQPLSISDKQRKFDAVGAAIDGMHPSDALALMLTMIDCIAHHSADEMAVWDYVLAVVQARIDYDIERATLLADCLGSA